MGLKYSNIKKAAEYQEGLGNYIKYLRNEENNRSKRLTGGSRTSRRDLTTVVVHPFALDFDADFWVSSKVNRTQVAALKTLVNNRFADAAASVAQGISLAGFKPARLTTFRGSGNATYEPSKITKLYYLKYEGETQSAPFGANTAAEEETEIARTIKAAAKTGGTAGSIRRASVSSERVRV